jgi:hypothetical protein
MATPGAEQENSVVWICAARFVILVNLKLHVNHLFPPCTC